MTIFTLVQPPACMISGIETPARAISRAAPTRALCPDQSQVPLTRVILSPRKSIGELLQKSLPGARVDSWLVDDGEATPFFLTRQNK